MELDALEARVPGTLEALVRAAVAPYQDLTLPDRLHDAEEAAETLVRQAWQAVITPYQVELQEIHREAKAILGPYEARLEALNDALQAQLAPLTDRLQEIHQAIDTEIVHFHPRLPARPVPEIEPPRDDTWLFDSQRDYLTQLDYYKARQGS